MSQELPKTPSVYLSMLFGGSLSSAWIATRPTEIFVAVCLGTGSCAALLILLLARRFDDAFKVQMRRQMLISRRAKELENKID